MMQFQRGHTHHNFESHTSREAIYINNLEKISKIIPFKLNHIVISVTYHNFYFPGKHPLKLHTSQKSDHFIGCKKSAVFSESHTSR